MIDIPSAADPREAMGGARATPQNTPRNKPLLATVDASDAAFAAALQSSLITAFTGATAQSSSAQHAPQAQSVRPPRSRADDIEVSTHARVDASGNHRFATATDLATAELAGQGESARTPPDSIGPRETGQQASKQPGSDSRSQSDAQSSRSTSSDAKSAAQEPASSNARPHAPTAASPTTGAPVAGDQSPKPAQAPISRSGAAQIATVARIAAPAGARTNATARLANLTGPRFTTRSAARPNAPARPADVARHAKAFQAQLARGLAAALKKGQGTLTLHLRPRSLGRLTIALSVRDSAVHAQVRASTDAARSLLESGAADLRDALASRGLTLNRLDVTLAEQQRAPDHDAELHATNDVSTGDQSHGRHQGDRPPRADLPHDVAFTDDPSISSGDFLALGLDVTI